MIRLQRVSWKNVSFPAGRKTGDELMRGRRTSGPLSLGSLNLSVTVNKVGDEKRALLSRHAQRTKRKRDYEVAGNSCYKIFGHNFIYADFAKLRRKWVEFLRTLDVARIIRYTV